MKKESNQRLNILILTLLVFSACALILLQPSPKPQPASLSKAGFNNIIAKPLPPAVKSASAASGPAVKKEPAAVQAAVQPVGSQLYFPILMYHYIGNNPNPADDARDSLSVTPDKFEEQMK